MLKRLTIRNFKAITDMTIDFTPMTVLIGGNASGKSTILQALDFLRSFAFRDIPEYLREKTLNFEELKSQLNDGQNKPIEFISIFEFFINNEKQEFRWHFQIDQTKGNWLIKEEIRDLSKEKKIYSEDAIYSRGFDKGGPMMARDSNTVAGIPSAVAHSIAELNLQASWLKYLSGTSHGQLLKPLIDYLSGSIFYGLLSPDSIRKGNGQTLVGSIGINGVNLAACIHNMTPDDREQLDETISKLVDYRLKIKTADVGRIELYIEEEFCSTKTRINKDHISDGLLRIIAFVVISFIEGTIAIVTEDGNKLATESSEIIIASKNDGLILLDEIENGINPYLTEKVILSLRGLVEKAFRQLVITTHSPVMLNDFRPEEIVFLWRDKNGSVQVKKFFDTEEMQEALSFLNPGEIWENYGKDTILEKLGVKQEDK
jgi:predicted ATPase